MAKISVIGMCGMSIFMKVDHFHQSGETLIADDIFFEVGGKGINQAIAASRMGEKVSFLTAVGDDSYGKECMEVARQNGLNATFAIKENKKTAIAYILTDKDGNNQVTEFMGAVLDVSDVMKFEEEISDSDILLLQQEIPNEVNKKAIEIAKKYGVKVILNPAPPRKIDNEIVNEVYIITPNEQEARFIDSERFRNIVTTLGANGCMINGKTIIDALTVDAVDTTGAGDTFNGVLASWIAEGESLENSARYAIVASGISVTRNNVLNAIPYRKEILKGVQNNEK